MKTEMDRMIEHIDEMVRLDEHTTEGKQYLDHFRRVAESYKKEQKFGFLDGFTIGVSVGIIFTCLGVVLFVNMYV
jgi:hypothetical protein